MRNFYIVFCVGLLALQACNNNVPPAQDYGPPPPAANPLVSSQDETVATVGDQNITRRELNLLLTRAYGLRVLFLIMQRDLAQEQAAQFHVVVTPQDITREKTIEMKDLQRAAQEVSATGTLSTQPDVQWTPDLEESLMNQYLKMKNLTRTEFDVELEISANLRKVAEVRIPPRFTEDMVRAHFNVLYGGKVRVRKIVCNDTDDVAAVRRDLKAGKSFEDVARARSVDRWTAANGGEVFPFTLQDNRIPEVVRTVAFGLKDGEISDDILVGSQIWIIQLIDRLPPAHARFEDYRDAVRQEMVQDAVAKTMTEEWQAVGQLAMESMHITDPLLQQQWQVILDQQRGQMKDTSRIRQELDKEHALTAPATRATTPPATTMP